MLEMKQRVRLREFGPPVIPERRRFALLPWLLVGGSCLLVLALALMTQAGTLDGWLLGTARAPALPEPVPPADLSQLLEPPFESVRVSRRPCEDFLEPVGDTPPRTEAEQPFSIRALLEQHQLLVRCQGTVRTELSLCLAVSRGRLVGATITLEPKDPKLEECLRNGLAELTYPLSAELRVARSSLSLPPRPSGR